MPASDSHRIPLPHLPAGTEAWLSGPAGTSLRDRRGHLKATTVDLRPASPSPTSCDTTPAGLAQVDVSWLLSAGSRSATAWTKRFGPRALAVVHELVAHGVVQAQHQLTPNLRLGPLIKTVLTPDWRARAHQCTNARQTETAALAAQAVALAEQLTVDGSEPALGAWLRAATGKEPRLRDVLAATTDLLSGLRHDGPRAFSQHHFGDTKSNDDIASVLLAAHASDEMVETLGLARAQYVGLAGPIRITGPRGSMDLAGLRGPAMLRTDQPLDPVLTHRVRAVVVVENLQAAETLSTTHADVALIHTNGQPGDALLDLIGPLVQTRAVPVHVIPDADFGGCRIAQRILTLAPQAPVHDIGAYPHTPGRQFGQSSLDGLTALLGSPVAGLARACLDRGYVVEQESAARAAVHDLLGPSR